MSWLLWLAAAAAAAAAIDVTRRLLIRGCSFQGKHVLITGGSSGIGLAIAAEMLRKGARVTLLARSVDKLRDAVAQLQSSSSAAAAADVGFVSASISDAAALEATVKEAVAARGEVDVLVCNAGSATPGLFLEMPIDTFESQMQVNYLGTVRTIKAVVPSMVARRQGHIIIVASACAVVSFLGYSAYAPTKFALRGLADALRNELSGLGVRVQIGYPPDTDTPGFKAENESKPPETLQMVPIYAYPADRVAKSMLSYAENGYYHLLSPDLLQNWLVSAAAGVSPRGFVIIESLLLPIASIVESLAVIWFDHVARRYAARVGGAGATAVVRAKRE